MRERWPVLESRVQRERGDCLPGLILSAGDGCRYPNSRELLVVSQDGSASFGAVGGRYPDGFRFVPWGGLTQESVLYEPLREGRQIVVRIGADTPRSIGNCAVGLSVSPGQSCRTGPDLPRFQVFDDAALYDGVAASNDLEVQGEGGAPAAPRRASAGPQLHHPRTPLTACAASAQERTAATLRAMFNGLRPPPSAVLIGARRWRVVALVGVLAALLVAVMLSHQSVAAEDEYLLIEARVAAQRHDDGRVEVLLEVRRDVAGWVEQITPVHRFLPDPAPIGVWWNSTPPVTVPGVPGQFGL